MSSTTGRSSPRKLRHYDDLAILDFIDRHKGRNGGRSPSERQIAAGVELSGKSVAHSIVRRLVTGGFLLSDVPQRGWAADLTITRAGQYALLAWRAQRETTSAAYPSTAAGLDVAVRGAS
jgi:SOS-response transcriptional repressor LexA